ncbi:hypothetical protein BDV93DRAFT_609980 [Ceratobasidium sp. AG-I]|nr:hypothetical protein BDV93DRAFT_609980 [Ceratobasidium sp. AG-I]
MPSSEPRLHRIFEVPELVRFICKYSSISQRARLARVSRSFFNIAVPFVWERVNGVHRILKILPGATVSRRAAEPSYLRQNYTIFIPRIGDADLERFDCYAPFVKHLEIYPSSAKDYLLKGWQNLSALAMQRSILPNLLELRLTSVSAPTTHDQCLWIRSFLSPSLSVIHVEPDLHDDPPPITHMAAVSLLQHITSNSPNVQHLALFPPSSPSLETEKNGHAILEFWGPSFYGTLPSLQLRELICTTAIFTPEHFKVLNSMSALESLQVHNAGDPVAFVRLTSPPSLRRFALHNANWQQFQKIWDLELFSGLTLLEISFDDYSGQENYTMWLTDLISLVCKASPVLTSLSIDFGGEEELRIDNIAPLQPLAALPLQTVVLKCVAMIEELVLSQMALAWPMVTKLKIPDLVFSLDELHYFARLPKLEHLIIGLSFESLEVKSEIPACKSLAFHTLESSTEVDVDVSLSLLARHLLLLWPNIQQVTWTDLVLSEHYKGTELFLMR